MSIEQKYKFEIRKSGDGWWLAECFIAGESVGVTQGRNEEEIFEMIADLYLAVGEIETSWWNKLLCRFMIYKK